MASNFFGLLEDVSSNDPVEIAKKRQHEAAVAKKNAEKKEQQEKQAQHQKEQQSSAKKATDKKPVQRNTKPQQTRTSDSADAVAEPAFERKDRSRGGRPSKSAGKHHVGPKTGREFDRHSGTGRGKEVAKNGGGSRNWGKPGAEVVEQTEKKKPFLKKPRQTVEKVEETTPTTPVDEEKKEEEAPVENAETTNAQVPEEEEEDKSITYDKLLAEKKKNKTSKPKPRKAGEGVAIDPSVMKGSKVEKKDETVEDFDFPVQGITAVKKAEAKKQKKQSADSRLGLGEFFKDDKDALEKLAEAQQYKPQSNKRGGSGRGRGGRGGSRGGRSAPRGSRPTKGSNQAFNPSDFPELK